MLKIINLLNFDVRIIEIKSKELMAVITFNTVVKLLKNDR